MVATPPHFKDKTPRDNPYPSKNGKDATQYLYP